MPTYRTGDKVRFQGTIAYGYVSAGGNIAVMVGEMQVYLPVGHLQMIHGAFDVGDMVRYEHLNHPVGRVIAIDGDWAWVDDGSGGRRDTIALERLTRWDEPDPDPDFAEIDETPAPETPPDIPPAVLVSDIAAAPPEDRRRMADEARVIVNDAGEVLKSTYDDTRDHF